VVAPVLTADGCIGVLSAEIRDGGEASETVQALAAIVAAQLAGVLASTPAPNEAFDRKRRDVVELGSSPCSLSPRRSSG
jgi:hypothetical protein